MCGCGVRRRVAAAKASARQGQCGHEPGRLLSLAATLMLLARRSTEDPPERREAVQRPRAGLLLRAPHHSSRRMALRYFTLSSSLCAETIGATWEVRSENNMERVRAMIAPPSYLYEVSSARAPEGFHSVKRRIFRLRWLRVYLSTFTNLDLRVAVVSHHRTQIKRLMARSKRRGERQERTAKNQRRGPR